MTKLTILFWASIVISGFSLTAWAEDTIEKVSTNGKSATYNITTSDKFGTIAEEYSPAMYAKVEYIPASGAASYQLININGSHGTMQQADKNNDLAIPSWKLFSW